MIMEEEEMITETTGDKMTISTTTLPRVKPTLLEQQGTFYRKHEKERTDVIKYNNSRAAVITVSTTSRSRFHSFTPSFSFHSPGYFKLILTGAASWFAGATFHSNRVLKKAKTKHQKEQKQLYSQYYNDVYKLTEQNQELNYLVEQYKEALKSTEAKHELEALQRDYDEFKQPDIDGDDRISRAEFNMYVKNYLSNYPGLTEADYPRFEDFDHDHDGFVSFQEYAEQMALQTQQAELEAAAGGGSVDKAQALNDMYGSSTGAGQKKAGQGASFEDIYSQYL